MVHRETQPPSGDYSDVMMGTMASQITSLTIVYSTVYSDADERKHQSSASLAFVRGIHRWPVNSPQKWLVTRNMSPFDDVIRLIITATSNSPCSLTCDSSINILNYRETSNNRRILVGNNIVHHLDVVGASPVDSAPTTSSFSTWRMASMDWAKKTAGRDERHLSFGIWYDLC